MSKSKKVLLIITGVLIAVFATASLYIRWISRRALPDYNSAITLDGIKDRTLVYRDEYAIPHIFAKNEGDLYQTIGYCMAQDRLWQMDMIRRVTAGRVSEILGEDLLETDLLMRALRIPAKSRLVLSRTDKKIIQSLESFSKGVNQYIRNHKDMLPVEFTILGYEPEVWQPEHSVNLVGFMAWGLAMAWDNEIALYKILQKVGEKKCREIVPDIPALKSVVYTDFAENIHEYDLRQSLLTRTDALEKLGLAIFDGSNNWVVSGQKSITGKPIFAYDMHLALFAPGIWYQMHLVVEGRMDVTGVALPGQPNVVCGHNKNIAWGMTNVMVDDMDFYSEKINPNNPNEYLYKGKWRSMSVKKEEIKIKGGNVVEREIKFTHRGPIVSELRKIKDSAISMRWIGNEYSNEVRAIFLLNRAKNWKDFTNAVKTFTSLSQNIVYADTAGNIGSYCCAGVPIRKKGDGISIAPGWTDEYDWNGLVPFEKLPHSFNPEDNFVSSANNKIVGNHYPYYISHWFDLSHRFDRITEMLREKDRLSVKDFKRMQNDFRSKQVDEMKDDIINIMRSDKTLSSLGKKSLNELGKWDNILTKESAGAAIFEKFYVTLIKNLFLDEMGDELFQEFSKRKILARHGAQRIWEKKSSAWCDDVKSLNKKEDFTDIVRMSFRESVEWLNDELGSDPESWQWGNIHKFKLDHPLGIVWAPDWLFNLNSDSFKVGGSLHTVCPYSYKLTEPFGVYHGASQRHIYSLSNWDDSLSVIPTGNSGIPASSHYLDQTELFVEGKYRQDYVSRYLIEKHAKYTMVVNGK